jgi:hypothetical protein
MPAMKEIEKSMAPSEQEFRELETKLVQRIRILDVREIEKGQGTSYELAADNEITFLLLLGSDGKWDAEIEGLAMLRTADGRISDIRDNTARWDLGEKPPLQNVLVFFALVNYPFLRHYKKERLEQYVKSNKKSLTVELVGEMQGLFEELGRELEKETDVKSS